MLDTSIFKIYCLQPVESCAQYGHSVVYRWLRSSPVRRLYAGTGKPSLKHKQIQLTIIYAKRLPISRTLEAVFQPQVIQPFETNHKLATPFGVLANQYEQTLVLTHLVAQPITLLDEPLWKRYFGRNLQICKMNHEFHCYVHDIYRPSNVIVW